jgi:hypothetical protein
VFVFAVLQVSAFTGTMTTAGVQMQRNVLPR